MSSNDSNVQIENVLIEEVKIETLAASELSEFVPISQSLDAAEQPRIAPERISQEREEQLIKQLIDGELSFSDYNLEIGEIINVDDIDEDDEPDNEQPSTSSQSSAVAAANVPTTSQSFTDDTGQKNTTIFGKEYLKQQRQKLRGNFLGNTTAKRICVLPPALQGLMGEANLCYARGKLDLAEKICLEIIRQVPLAHEPFLTLAQIHESIPEKHIEFLLLAAHLNPGDVDQWDRIAQLSIEQGNVRQAINCYAKASRKDPQNIVWRMRRIELLQSIGEDKMALKSYYTMLQHIPAEQGDFLLETAKMVSDTMIKDNRMRDALHALNCAYTKVPHLFKLEDINVFLDILIVNESYREALDVLTNSTQFTYVQNNEKSAEFAVEGSIHSCFIPADMLLDFRSKGIVSLVHLKAFHLIGYLFENIFQYINVEEDGDCYLDIAEALMKHEKYTEALELLVPLVQSTNFSLAAVWLRYADCYRAIGSVNEAIEAYKNVVNLAPQHFDARLTLSALLKQQGRYQEALTALEQNAENEVLDPCVLYERCFMLKETGNLEQYVDVGFLLLSRHCIRLRNREEMLTATTIAKYYSKLQIIKENRRSRGTLEEQISDGPEFTVSEKEPTFEMEWDLLVDILQILVDKKQFALMQKIVFTMNTGRYFAAYRPELEFWAKLAAFYNRDSQFAYTLTKDLVIKHSTKARAWNFFNCVIQFTDDIRYSKFLLRLFRRTELEDITPALIRANYFLSSGSYKYALNDYAYIYRKTNSALTALLIAVTYAHLAQQKFMEKKTSLMAQSIAFADKYKEHRRGEAPHEVHYNLGRLYHQFGLNELAVRHYKEVLKVRNRVIDENREYLDLSREAAFNLHLIYRSSGNIALARHYLYNYIVI